MNIKTLAALSVVLSAGAVFAEDEAPAAGAKEGAPAAQSPTLVKAFTTLPFCQEADGTAEVMIPGAEGWAAVQEGKFYPLGSSYRTSGEASRLVVAFGPESRVTLTGTSSFGTRAQGLEVTSRTIVIGGGTVLLDLARTLPEGKFVVAAAGFTVKNPAGESKFVQTQKPDGTESVVRCVTGSLCIEGRHFSIPQMRAADEIRIRNTTDNLETFLYGTSGDYIVKIDRGVVLAPKVDDEGNLSTVAEKVALDWHLSPRTKVRISRILPAIGDKMSVAVMTFDATGEMKNNFAYSEGRPEVNSGELVKQVADEAGSATAKKAAAAAEETTTSAPAAEEAEDSKNKNKKEEE